MDRLAETLEILASERKRSPKAAIAFSGDKDSWVLLDLALRAFETVDAFALHFLTEPLEQEEVQFLRAESLGATVHRMMGPGFFSAKRDGLFCDPESAWDDLKLPSGMDLLWHAAHELGFERLLTGNRKSEGVDRRSLISQQKHKRTVHPIQGWRRCDVLSYLGTRKLPLPPSEAKDKGGPRIDKRFLLWCHDKFPSDFERILVHFPFAQALVVQRELYVAS